MNRLFAAMLLLIAGSLSKPAWAAPITMTWSPVGNPGNAADASSGFGAVAYSYSIGTYDVTNSQYVVFLNANDPNGSDPLGLYNGGMSDATYGGINFNSLAPSGSMYSIVSGNGNNPVNYVTWYDAVRFANWMDNLQPLFTSEPTASSNATENGAYMLDGFTPTPSNGNSIVRNAGATVFLPSEDEWYKAAYYNPATSSYFLYPTSSNTAPNAVAPLGAPADSANYNDAVDNLTAVGAYSLTTSPYLAYDMGGNVFQWNEALIDGSFRGLRGGPWDGDSSILQSSAFYANDPTNEDNYVGFRVASIPEPSSAVLALVACGMALWWRKRK